MNRDQVEHVLKPIWIGFAAALARLEEQLEQSKSEAVDRLSVLDRLKHEAELEQAIAFLRARSRAYIGDGLYQAVDTGRAVYTWPNVYPSSEAPALAVSRWKESRQTPPNLQPFRREA